MLEKTLESPLDCKEIQQSILKEISPGISLEGMMVKLRALCPLQQGKAARWDGTLKFKRKPLMQIPSSRGSTVYIYTNESEHIIPNRGLRNLTR